MAPLRILSLLLAVLQTAPLVLGYDGDKLDGVTGCPKAFQEKCKCQKQRYHYWRPDEELYVVNCTNTGFTDTSMLQHLPTNTQVLIFAGNQVPILDWNIFGRWDEHKDLEVVDFSNNKIKEIAGKTFHKVGNVKRLVLDHNDLMISGPNLHPRVFTNFYNLEALHMTNTFTETIDSKWYLKDLKAILLASNMTKLNRLHLEQNEIWKIEDDDMFCALPALTDLYLGDNQLQEVNFSLQCLKQLRYLDLEYNKIKRLSDRTLKKFDKVFAENNDKSINLKGNPFQCDCGLRNLFDWLKTTKTSLFHKDELRCYDGVPAYNAGKKITNVERLECPPATIMVPSSQASGSSALTNVLLVLLIIVIIVVGIALVYYNGQKMKETVKPLVVGFQKSMQYKTIEKEEEAAQEVDV